MNSSDEVGVTFVNTVVGRGILNGVINLSLSVFNFTPSANGESVDLDPTIACRLRMDRVCAAQLRDVLTEFLSQIEQVESKSMEQPEKIEGLVSPKAKAPEKMN